MYRGWEEVVTIVAVIAGSPIKLALPWAESVYTDTKRAIRLITHSHIVQVGTVATRPRVAACAVVVTSDKDGPAGSRSTAAYAVGRARRIHTVVHTYLGVTRSRSWGLWLQMTLSRAYRDVLSMGGGSLMLLLARRG